VRADGPDPRAAGPGGDPPERREAADPDAVARARAALREERRQRLRAELAGLSGGTRGTAATHALLLAAGLSLLAGGLVGGSVGVSLGGAVLAPWAGWLVGRDLKRSARRRRIREELLAIQLEQTLDPGPRPCGNVPTDEPPGWRPPPEPGHTLPGGPGSSPESDEPPSGPGPDEPPTPPSPPDTERS